MAISDWMPTLIARLGTVTGLAVNGTQPHRVRGYTDLPAALVEMPTMIVLPLAAVHTYSAGGPAIWWHDLQATLYLSGQVLPEAFAKAIPYIKNVRDVMAANVTLNGLSWTGGSIGHWTPQPDAPFYQGPGRVTYSGRDGVDREFIGIIFRMQVKEVETTVTVTP